MQSELLRSAGWLPGSDGTEIRSTLPTRIARTLFFVHQGEAILLHGFIKKTKKTPREDTALALRRKMLTSKTVKTRNKHSGSSFDDFLKQEGSFKDVQAAAFKRARALKVNDMIKKA
ncbi:MAG: type II toxin-antitoxin system RelE/ParE family toxin [Candidatus Udaeobacter sp.]